ncbi:MAG: FHA domain-containing protein [Actinomycetota bacterium]
MIDFDSVPGAIHRGLGYVGRWPGVVLVVPSQRDQDEAVERLLRRLGADATAEELTEAVEEAIRSASLTDVGVIAIFAGGPVGLVQGAVEILVDGRTVVSGLEGPQQESLNATGQLTVRAANLVKAAEPIAPFDLRQGIAPGAGITLGQPQNATAMQPVTPPKRASANNGQSRSIPFRSERLGRGARPDVRPPLPIMDEPVEAPRPPVPTRAPAPAPAQAPAPVPAGARSGRARPTRSDEAEPAPLFKSVPEPARGPTPDPLPGSDGTPMPGPGTTGRRRTHANQVMVQGIMCSRGHFNNPAASFCGVCGISMVHVTHNLVPGPRPTLGFVVFDDGSTYGLDRSYLIGREPGDTDDAHTTALSVQDNNETLSRRHAEIRLVDWAVHLVDLGSTNGSFIWDDTNERWNQVNPNEAVILNGGDTVALGRRTFVFESAINR